MQSSIRKWGNSLAVRIPKAFALQLGLVEGTEVDLTVGDGRIVLAAARADYSLGELVEGITPENRHVETDWGVPQGSEQW